MDETWPQMRKRHREEKNRLIIEAMVDAGGNTCEAARSIAMPRSAIYYAMQDFGIAPLVEEKLNG